MIKAPSSPAYSSFPRKRESIVTITCFAKWIPACAGMTDSNKKRTHAKIMKTTSSRGFSLLELSVVITIIAVVAGLSLSVGSTHIKVAETKNAKQTVDNVKIALMSYKNKTGRYPCPANPALASTNVAYGTEATGCDSACPAGLVCNSNIIQGAIPFKTIGLSESSAYDSWENKVTYVVDKTHTVSSEYAEGTLPVYDAAGNEITTSTVLGKAIFILLSHGKDGKGAYKKDGTLRAACGAITKDSENCDGDAIYTYTSMNDAGDATTNASYYQDFLSWQVQDDVEEPVIEVTSDEVTYNKYLATPYSNSSTSASATCVITTAKKLYCSGSDNNGMQGNGAGGDQTVFTQVGTDADWEMIAGRSGQMCGIRDAGKLFCWGLYGPTGVTNQTPTQVTAFNNWESISLEGLNGTGRGIICGVLQTGVGYCWSNATTYSYATTGTGVVAGSPQTTPALPVADISNWAYISTTNYQACGITDNNKLYCWGRDNARGWGDGTTSSTYDRPMELQAGTTWKALSAGEGQYAIKTSGELMAWGRSNVGQLNTAVATNPTMFEITGNGWNNWIGITQSGRVGCGIRGNGTVYCFGSNGNWQAIGRGGSYSTGDIQLNTLVTNFRAVSSGQYHHTCGVTADGDLYCWGINNVGQFGTAAVAVDGTTRAPTLITLGCGEKVKTD